MKWLSLSLVLAVVTGLVVLACNDLPPPITCTNIPTNGCPDEGSATCMDPTCAGVFACMSDGTWTLEYNCPPPEAGPPDAGVDAPTLTDAQFDIDAPPGAYGGPGCIDLEQPDCPLGTVLICNQQCCGCEDLYVCDDGGWDFWGECTEAGLVPAQN